MEKKRISDFSIEELKIFEDFVKQFKTIEGAKYHLNRMQLEKSLGIEKEWPTYEEKEMKKWDQRYLPYRVTPFEGRLLEEFSINNLDELANADLDEIMDIASQTIIDFQYFPEMKTDIKTHLGLIVKEYKTANLKKQTEKVENNGQAK